MKSIISELYSGDITDIIDNMPEGEELDKIQKIIDDEIGY